MASPTQWTWVWVNSRSWWWTGGLACYDSWGRKESDTTEWLNWLIPQFGFLSPVSSFRLPSGHSGPVLTLSNAARASLFSPGLLVAYLSVWATSPLGVAVRYVTCGFYLSIFSSWLCCPLRFQNSPDPPVRGFPGVWKVLLFHTSLPGVGLSPWPFCLSFYLLYFVLLPFEDNGLPFWVPGVLCQCSGVVLWNFLSAQMIFRWICGGESGLPVLSLCHLRTSSETGLLTAQRKSDLTSWFDYWDWLCWRDFVNCR